MNFPITCAQFKSWLEGHEPRQVVGYPLRLCDCPLARVTGMTINYTNFNAWAESKDGKVRLPEWAETFAHAVDDECLVRVTARKALEILGRC